MISQIIFNRTVSKILPLHKPYSEILIKDGWEVVQETIVGTEFKFSFKGRGKGDYETALWQLGYALPDGVPMESYLIDWDSSEY